MRLILALVLSFLVFMLWNAFFGPQTGPKPPAPERPREAAAPEPASPPAETPTESAPAPAPPRDEGLSRRLVVDTPLYKAIFAENAAT
ncbi:MAG: hypothetical protein WHT06_15285, partial [Desulfobacterales bacterium]